MHGLRLLCTREPTPFACLLIVIPPYNNVMLSVGKYTSFTLPYRFERLLYLPYTYLLYRVVFDYGTVFSYGQLYITDRHNTGVAKR